MFEGENMPSTFAIRSYVI